MSLPLLALPGLTNDERLWRHQAAALAGEHAVTSFALAPHTSMGELAEMALARAPKGRFALAGLSMGGYCALEIMRRAPERVAALALLDTSARPDTPEQTQLRRQAIAASARDYGAAIDVFLPRLVHPARSTDPSVIAPLRDMAMTLGREGYVRQQEAIIGRLDSRSTLRDIRCPTLVLCGREDSLTPVVLHEELHAGIAGSRLVVIDDCGHASTLERPDEVTAALRAWLDQASG